MIVVVAIALLLMAALLVMFFYSRRTVKEEAMQNAKQSLERVVEQVDNILLSVEQSSGNLYWTLMYHLDEPDLMMIYCHNLVKANPYINGCTIVFEPNYYKNREDSLFMAYAHRTEVDTTIVEAHSFGNRPYTDQIWYYHPMRIGKPCWVGPLKNSDTETEPLLTFCLPISNAQRKTVGVLAVDVALNDLSEVVLAVKPSADGYCTLLGSDGSFIVHPDTTKLFYETVFSQELDDTDEQVEEVGRAMVTGKSGYMRFRLDGVDSYVFYEPFKRDELVGRYLDDMGWSVGVIYPEADIFGDYNRLMFIVLALSVGGILLLRLLCRAFIHHQLKPLRMLTSAAQYIAEGHYDEPVPDTRQQDEIGRLQTNFQYMQQSLAERVQELEQLKDTLHERGKVLRLAYDQAQEADRLKTAFLHNMTDQMIIPVTTIEGDVKTLCDGYSDMQQQEANQLTNEILEQGKTVTKLLNDLLEVSQEEKTTS